MSKPAIYLFCLFIALVIFCLIGCGGGNRGILKRVEKPAEKQLLQDWKEYKVYYRRHFALIYKIKDDRKIIFGNSWVKVSSEDMLAKSEIIDSTWVRQILGQNAQMLGYLVHRYQDSVYVEIIDENTVKLSYFIVQTSSGTGK